MPMRSLTFSLPVSILTVLLLSGTAFAHSGGTNAAGCHNDNINGGYHCHNSGASGGGGSTYTPSYSTPAKPTCGSDSYESSYGTCTKYPEPTEGSKTKLIQSSCPLGQFSVGDECLAAPQACAKRHGADAEYSYEGECWCRDGYEFSGNICKFVNRATDGRDETVERINRKIQQSATAAVSQSVTANRAVDGDTLKVTINGAEETIRVIGIDTPETVDPRKPVQCFGKEASARMKELVEGKTVSLVKNPAEERDKYQRLLRYIELEGEDIGASLIRDGYAFSYKAYPHPRLEQYNELEREAKEAGRGLWGDCEQDGDGGQFSDVSASHAYSDAIRWGKSSRVLNGYPDGTFKPDATVNRAEFLKIVLEAKGVDISAAPSSAVFTDVDESAWFAPYVRYAKANGIIQGYEDGSFKPGQPVNFAEALKMAYVALGVQADDTATGEWYEKYLRHAQSHSVLFNNDADVGTGMSRKDVVWIVWKLLNENPAVSASTASSSVRSSSSSSKKTVNRSFPINLVNNAQWKIRVTAPEDGLLNEQLIFEVTRKDDKFTVDASKKDLKSGNVGKTTGYTADFAKKYLSDEQFLEINYCWYKYEYIREGFSCEFYRVPVAISSSKVIGNNSFDFVFSSATDEFTVEILDKSDIETACNVKGEVYEEQKIYYTQDSKFFSESSKFKCFGTEDDAKKDGYVKSYR